MKRVIIIIVVLFNIVACNSQKRNVDMPLKFRGFSATMDYSSFLKLLKQENFEITKMEDWSYLRKHVNAKNNSGVIVEGLFYRNDCLYINCGTYMVGHPKQNTELHQELIEMMYLFPEGERGSAFLGSYVTYTNRSLETRIQYVNEDWIPEYHTYIQLKNLKNCGLWDVYSESEAKRNNENTRSKYQ